MRRAALTFIILLRLCVGAACAQSLSLVRDEEIERTISFYLTPLFEKAGLDAKNMTVHLVKDDSINAFAAKGLHVFIHTGLLLKADNAQEIIAVLAHETGHIAGGHIVRMYEHMAIARRSMLVSMVLGAAAVAAGGGGDAAAGALLGGFHSMQSVLAAYRRSEENAADQTAVALLRATGHDLSGFETIMRKLKRQDDFLSTDDFTLWRSHPAVKERLDFILNNQKKSTQTPAVDGERIAGEERLFQRMRAKLGGFLWAPSKTFERYSDSNKGLPVRYARAVALYRAGRFKDAEKQLDALIADYPDDAYFYELKGQILFETGRGAEAVAPYQKAVALLPDSVLMRVGLLQAQIAGEDDASLAEAEKALAGLAVFAREVPLLWRLQAIVYGRAGKTGQADYALAEYALATGDEKSARLFARRALDVLTAGTPMYQRAADIADTPDNGKK